MPLMGAHDVGEVYESGDGEGGVGGDGEGDEGGVGDVDQGGGVGQTATCITTRSTQLMQ